MKGLYYTIVRFLAGTWGAVAPESLVRFLAVWRLLQDTIRPGGRTRSYLGHLERVFPDADSRRRRSILNTYWQTHQRAMLGLFATGRLGAEGLLPRITWEARSLLDDSIREGSGTLLLAPHFGDERTLHIALAMAGYPMHVISASYEGHPGASRRARLENSMRWHHVAFPDDDPRWMFEALRRNEIIQIAPTAYGGPRGLWVDSFGVPVLGSSTPLRLARATGCRMLIALDWALPGLRYRIEFRPFEATGDAPMDEQRLFDELTRIGREAPGQYNWMNLSIRHRETNTIARLGHIPRDERELEAASVPSDSDPGLVSPADSLPVAMGMSPLLRGGAKGR